jgi:hypothetical protein
VIRDRLAPVRANHKCRWKFSQLTRYSGATWLFHRDGHSATNSKGWLVVNAKLCPTCCRKLATKEVKAVGAHLPAAPPQS